MHHMSNMKKSNKRQLEDGCNELLGSSVTIIQNDEKNRVEMHIRGVLPPPQLVSMELTTLDKMASVFNTIAIYLNTPGGSGDTMTEILNTLKRYRTVITIACGQASSAGFIIWCAGHVRVVQEYSVMMAHRENYVMEGKTDQHLNVAVFNQKNFSKLLSNICGDVLSPAEQETAKITEVFLSADDAISRKIAISWDDFINRDSKNFEVVSYVIIDDVSYEMIDENTVFDSNTEKQVNIAQLVYGLPYKI